MFLTLLYAMLRVKECAALRYADVLDAEGKVKTEIYLTAEQTKGRKGGTVFVSDMFNPKHLTKLTNDALARLEEERVAEEERIRQIAEDLKHAEEVKKAQEIKEALHRRNLIRHINKGLQTAIESALLGDKTARSLRLQKVRQQLKLQVLMH